MEQGKYSFSNISKTRNIILGIATIWIMFFHSPTLYIENIFNSGIIKNIIIFIRNLGNIGVDIFLILSAVGLYYSFSKDSNIKSFYKKRFVRILPAVIIVATIITSLIPGSGIKDFFERIFLISIFTNGNRDFWFFSLIMLLYIIYPLLYKLVDKYDFKAVILLVIGIIFFNFIIMFTNPSLYKKIEIAITRIPVFIIGIWLGKKSKEGVTISRKWLLLFLLILLVGISLLYYKVFNKYYFIVRYLYCPISISIVIILSYIFANVNKNVLLRFFIWIGSYSMEIYLLYEFLVKNCHNIFIYKDKYNIAYHLAAFFLTLILSFILKKLCNEITEKVINKEISDKNNVNANINI